MPIGCFSRSGRGQEPGREILYPVATVILGGLVTSTFCEFLIHPGLFWRFSGKDAEKLIHLEHSAEEDLTDHPPPPRVAVTPAASEPSHVS